MKEFVKEAVEEIVVYLRDRYQINVSTENFIRNKIQAALMRNPTKERLEAKLKLWETPGFSQFLEDLAGEVWGADPGVTEAAHNLKDEYLRGLEWIRMHEEDNSKFKQGKLDL